MEGRAAKFQARDCIRMTSVGCTSEPQARAVLALEQGDLTVFMDVVNTREVEDGAGRAGHWVNSPVGEKGATLLELALSQGREDFMEVLLRAGARQDIVSPRSGLAPPHVAMLQGSPKLLALLLKDRDAWDVNIRAADFKRAYTPLHFAAEKGDTESLNLLLGCEEVDVDAKDLKGDTSPLLLAVKEKHEEAAKLLVENGASLNIKAGRSTLRELFVKNFPALDPDTIVVKKSRKVMLDLKDKVFQLLKSTELTDGDYTAKLANFKTFMRFIRTLREQNVLDEVLDLACAKGLHEHVEVMLRKGASPNTASRPVLEAAYQGHHRILQVLSNYSTDWEVETGSKETVLHLVLKKCSHTGQEESYSLCLEVLLGLAAVRGMVNRRDDRDSTALHYATQKWGQNTVRRLLELGANIGMRNMWDELPITRIRPQTMEDFFSEFCLSSTGDVVHENFSITFRYDFLAPSLDSLPEAFRGGREQVEEGGIPAKEGGLLAMDGGLLAKEGAGQGHPLPETEPLWHMAQSKEHRHLLKHPVITSFLWYKWQRIRKYFNRNLRFFVLFVFCLTWFIFRHFGAGPDTLANDIVWYVFFIFLAIAMGFFIVKDWINDLKDNKRNQMIKNAANLQEGSCFRLARVFISNWVEAIFLVVLLVLVIFGESILAVVLAGLLVVFILREILQMTVSMKRYLTSLENWIELGIIFLTSVLLATESTSYELNRHLAAIAIVLSWAELIVLIGRHPKLKEYNIYVTMFLRVMKTFLLFFTWYSLFIIAFGLGFFILLHKEVDPDAKEEEYVFFNKAWLSLVKTTTMFVGELEFGDLPFDLDSDLAPLSYLFFLSFVFLIVVVLMNLLNGLAVSDTGLIREQAEIFSYRSQVETISTFESMLLGDPFDFLSNVPALLSRLPSCSLVRQLYRSNTLRSLFAAVGATEVLLFYQVFPTKSVTIRPNQREADCCCLRVDDIGRGIVAAAKEIIIKQQDGRASAELDEVKKTAFESRVEDKFQVLENKMENLEDKLDMILRKLTNNGN